MIQRSARLQLGGGRACKPSSHRSRLGSSCRRSLQGGVHLGPHVVRAARHYLAHRAWQQYIRLISPGSHERWTTDSQLEAFASQFGRVERIKFFEDKANGKSKARRPCQALPTLQVSQNVHHLQQGYALVEFSTADSAAACKARVAARPQVL